MTTPVMVVAGCSKPRCGVKRGGCDIVGCKARIAIAEAALATLPPDLLGAIEDGAVEAVARIDDIYDVPAGRIAAAAVSGFLATLPRGWRLVSPNGAEVRAWDFCRALEAWAATVGTPEPDAADTDGLPSDEQSQVSAP